MNAMPNSACAAARQPKCQPKFLWGLRPCLLIVALPAVLLMGADARAVSPKVAERVARASAAYAAGDYDAALTDYAEAEVDCPACPELAYNEGLAYYRKGDFDKARERFNSALATRDLGLEARAKYNLGDVAYSQALEKLSSLKEAIDLARQAIVHYRDALDLTPEDEDARANIETAQLLIKDLLDKQKKQQEKQKQNQQNQNQKKQQQKNQPQSKGQKDQKDQKQKENPKDQKKQGKKDQQQKKQDQPQQSQGDQQKTQQDESQKQKGEARQVGKMTPEEAQHMLQAVRDKEAQRREERAQRRRARRVRVSKDW